MVNLELYRVFYTVAKCGSLTKAAEELYISQPAVSQAIKQLEGELGGKLFNRVSRGMELTETGGKQMYEVVKKALDMLDSAEQQFSDIKTIASGSVRIAASHNVINTFLLPKIKSFREKYPNVSLCFINGTTKECVAHVKNDKADIGCVSLPIDEQGVLLTNHTATLNDVFVASSEVYKDLKDKCIKLNDLTNYPLMVLDNTTQSRKSLDTFLSTLNIKFVPDYELGSVELLVSMAKNGFGIACLPKEYVKEELKNGSLFELSVTPKLPSRSIGVIVNKQKTLGYAVNEFLKSLND